MEEACAEVVSAGCEALGGPGLAALFPDADYVDALLLPVAMVGHQKHLPDLPATLRDVFEELGDVLGVDGVGGLVEDEEMGKAHDAEEGESLGESE